MAIPSDSDVTQTETEKNKLKYKNLSTEIQRMWYMKRLVIPVINGATGIVTKGLKIPGNCIRKAFSGSPTNNSSTRDIAHKKESEI
jgi:hypothetical protein